MDKTTGYSLWMKIGFVVYGFFCVLLFSYMLFPYYALKPKFEDALSRVSGMDITVNTIRPALPLGWTMGGVKVSGNAALDSLTLKPRILPLVTGNIALAIKMKEGNGHLNGSIGTSFFKIGSSLDLKMEMKDFDISVFKYFSKKLDEISGKISGDVDLFYSRKRPDKSDGDISIIVNNGQIPLSVPNFPIAAIPFSKFELKAKMDNGLLKIIRAELAGNDVSGSMKGDIKLAEKLDASDMKFEILLKLSQAYSAFMGSQGSENVRIIIGGSIGSPRTSIQ
jgi:type II secretion system protein N